LTKIKNSTTTTYTDTGTATSAGLPVTSASSGNSLSVFNQAGSTSLAVNPSGNVLMNNGSSVAGSQSSGGNPGGATNVFSLMTGGSGTIVDLIVKAGSGQTADMQDFKDSNFNILSK